MIYRLRVRYGECDPQGIVFNAHYLGYCDIAITELFRQAIGSWSVLTERGYDAVVAEAKLRFRAPARFDDEIDLEASVAELGTTSMVTSIYVRRGDETLVEAELRHVFVSRETWEKVAIPDWIRGHFESNDRLV